VETAILPDGVIVTYAYDAAQSLRRIADSFGNRVEYSYDVKGNRRAEYTYDPSGSLVRQVDMAYDVRNRLATFNEGGSVTQTIFDAIGNLRSETDPNQNPTTQHSFDALNRLVQTVDRIGGITSYKYDVNDHPVSVAPPGKDATQYSYDDLGNLIQETSPDRGTITYTHDAAGNIETMTDALGVEVSYSYDALNRLTLADLPGATEDIRYVYDSGTFCGLGIGRLCSVVDQSGTTLYSYDGFGNTTTQQKSELGLVYTTGYGYDAVNRLTKITYPDGREVNYPRDAIGRIAGITTTVNGSSQTVVGDRSYRADGLVTGEAYGNTLHETRTYDIRGHLREVYVGSVDTRLMSYDYNGNVTSAQSLQQTGAYLYDALDRLTQDQVTTTEVATTDYAYDGNGNRTSENTTTYIYDSDSNRLSGTRRPKGSFTVNGAGQTLSDNRGRNYTYNAAGRVQEVTASGVTANYFYNYQGLRTRKTLGSQVTIYHYDFTGRLLAETSSTGRLQRAYLYDDEAPVAQIEAVSVAPFEIVLDNHDAVYVGNWPTATSLSGFYGTDYQTNTKGKGKDTAAWTPSVPVAGTYQVYARWVAASSHAGNALFSIEHSAGTTTVPVDQRANGGEWVLLGTFTLDAGTNTNIVLSGKAKGTVIAGAVKVGPTTGGATREAIYYLHTDHLTTPRLATDAAGEVVWRWDGRAFGDSAPIGGITVNLRYPGQYYDQETGLHYNAARYYDSGLGRYLTSDPIGLGAGPNTYLYVGANPLYWIDATGLAAECIFTPLSFRYSASGQGRTMTTRRWDSTTCEPINSLGAPLPPDNPRRLGRGRPLDWISPKWKCQTTYFMAGHMEELYKATAWGVLRCYDDCGKLADEMHGYKRWEPADEWRIIEGTDFEDSYRGPIVP